MKRRSVDLTVALGQLGRDHLLRTRRTIEGFTELGNRVAVSVEGRPLIDFSSNDYLGLARHPALADAMAESAQRYGSGSGASHLITGHGAEHARLEEELAAYTGRERALLFSTGYMANLAVMSTLAGRGESVLLDRLSHASLIDGALLSGARFSRYTHADAAAVETSLAADEDRVAVVATDGVFSMDGDVGPLDALARSCRAHQAWLIVDDAHGLGVLGASGRGTVEYFGLDNEAIPVLVGTLGKAFGSFGAFVAGSRDLIEFVLQKARPYIYTTALPQPVAAATRKALEVAQREPWRRERVMALAERFREGARRMGLPLAAGGTSAMDTSTAMATSTTAGIPVASGISGGLTPLTPIQPVIIGDEEAALRAQRELFSTGYCVIAVRPPTVPRGSARLRVTLSAAHTEAQVDGLVDALSLILQ